MFVKLITNNNYTKQIRKEKEQKTNKLLNYTVTKQNYNFNPNNNKKINNSQIRINCKKLLKIREIM